jgi:hypothetical protein
METLYRAITQNDIGRYKTICQALITKTQVANDYNALRILFIDNNSLIEVFQQEITQAIGGHFQGNLPTQAHAYASKQSRSVIAINTDDLRKKTTENCEFIILEEFCNLLDYAAADFSQSEQFLNFRNEYSGFVDSHFASEVTENLGRHYNQYYVNKLMLTFDVEKWIQFKSDLNGPSSRAQLSRLFAEIRATRPPKHCLVILTTEILRMLCFAHAVESFLAHVELPEIQIQQLTVCKNNAIETIKFAEQNAKAIDNAYPNTIDYFRRSDFVSKDNFFIRVRQFFNYLHFFG